MASKFSRQRWKSLAVMVTMSLEDSQVSNDCLKMKKFGHIVLLHIY
jgi:hypothetical protein